jgi:hypothetical protein
MAPIEVVVRFVHYSWLEFFACNAVAAGGYSLPRANILKILKILKTNFSLQDLRPALKSAKLSGVSTAQDHFIIYLYPGHSQAG